MTYTPAFYHADGNGNVTYLLKLDQTAGATYTYDPYGRQLASTGTLANANTYRFSSKELMLASGLYYYGYRFYDPNTQRWLNRDPIRESGGINLYRMAENNPTGRIDSFGLEITYGGEVGPDAKALIECWTDKLPKDDPLKQLVDDLKTRKETTEIGDLAGRKLANGKPDPIPSTEPRVKGGVKIAIDNKYFHFDNDPTKKLYTFREALAHELLHARDQLNLNPRGHGDGFLEEEGPICKSAKTCMECR